MIDVEDAAGLAPATVAARARQWVDRVHAALGVTPIVYTGKYFWRDEVGGLRRVRRQQAHRKRVPLRISPVR